MISDYQTLDRDVTNCCLYEKRNVTSLSIDNKTFFFKIVFITTYEGMVIPRPY